MMGNPCTCPTCRRAVLKRALRVFEDHRRFLEAREIRWLAHPRWCPLGFLVCVLADALAVGLLIRIQGDTVATYFPSLLTLPISGSQRKRGGA